MSVLDLPQQRAGELITPTGVLVYSGEPHTPEWYSARMEGVTATDMVKCLGYGGEWGNATSVWGIKTGRLEDEPGGEAAQWGLDHEPSIARRWGERHGTATRKVGVLAHVQHNHHRASLDALVDVCPDGDGPCGAQWKCRSAFKADDWKHDVPDDVYFQEQWESHVSGFRHMHVGVLIDGNRLKSFRVDRDEADLAKMIARAEEVWACVLANEPPADAPNHLLASVLHRLYPNREGQALVSDETAAVLIGRYANAKAAARVANATQKATKQAVEAAEAALLAQLGDKAAAFTEGNPEPAFAVVASARAGYSVAPSIHRSVKVNTSWVPLEGNEA